MMATTPANLAFFILQTQQKSSVELNTELLSPIFGCFIWLMVFCLIDWFGFWDFFVWFNFPYLKRNQGKIFEVVWSCVPTEQSCSPIFLQSVLLFFMKTILKKLLIKKKNKKQGK